MPRRSATATWSGSCGSGCATRVARSAWPTPRPSASSATAASRRWVDHRPGRAPERAWSTCRARTGLSATSNGSWRSSPYGRWSPASCWWCCSSCSRRKQAARSPVVVPGPQWGDPHRRAGVWRVQHPAVADVDAHVVDGGPCTGPEEHQITRTQGLVPNVPAETRLVRSVARQGPAEGTEDAIGEAGAVDARLRHTAPEVRRPQVGARDPELGADGRTAYDAVVGVPDHGLCAELSR